MVNKILILPGDGIGPEVMVEVEKVISWFDSNKGFNSEIKHGLVGGASYDADKVSITDETMNIAKNSDAILFGAVGGSKWDDVEYENRPEAGLLRLRKELDLFANLRPAMCFSALADSSSLKKEIVDDLDILIVRELTGGVYFGEPRGIEDLGDGNSCLLYTSPSPRDKRQSRMPSSA